ncbi:MAG: hypothetical protein RLZZ546_2304 [Bacteroidota bacterium]|jgi:hypothetical protein
MKKLEKFLEKANKIHNGLYSYDNVLYINCKEKVSITCKTRGDFLQTPDNHISRGSRGCPTCNKPRHTTDSFLLLCKEKHINKYDYSKVIFTNTNDKIKII